MISPTSQKYVQQRQDPGQTLVEIIIAIAVIIIIVAGLATAATVGIRNATYSKTRNQASKYAQEAMEWIRSQRDTDWSSFSSRNDTYCLNSLGSWQAGACPANSFLANIYKRQATLTSPAPNQRNILVTVSWTDSKGTHQVSLTTILTNWK